MKIYYIDVENVNWFGVNYLLHHEKFEVPGDKIHLFLNSQQGASNLPFDVFDIVTSLGIKCINTVINKTGKNYLDFHLTSTIAFDIGRSFANRVEYIIVSNDKGFDAIVDFWNDPCRKNTTVDVKRMSVPNSTAHLTIMEADKISDERTIIQNILASTSNKSEIHNTLVQKFGAEKGHLIYTSLKDTIN